MKFDFYPLKLYFRKWPVMGAALVSLALNLATWFWLMVEIPRRADQLVLHYTILFGVDSLGDYRQIFYIPLLGFIIFIINLLVGWIVYAYDTFLAELLNFASVFCQAFALIGAAVLIFLNV